MLGKRCVATLLFGLVCAYDASHRQSERPDCGWAYRSGTILVAWRRIP